MTKFRERITITAVIELDTDNYDEEDKNSIEACYQADVAAMSVIDDVFILLEMIEGRPVTVTVDLLNETTTEKPLDNPT